MEAFSPRPFHERCQSSLHLAESLFHVIRKRGGEACNGKSCTALIHTSDLVRLVGQLRDRADGSGGLISVESQSPTPTSATPRDQEVGLEEFLGVMREAYSVVGHRVFDAVLKAELAASKAGKGAQPPGAGACVVRKMSAPAVIPLNTSESEISVEEKSQTSIIKTPLSRFRERLSCGPCIQRGETISSTGGDDEQPSLSRHFSAPPLTLSTDLEDLQDPVDSPWEAFPPSACSSSMERQQSRAQTTTHLARMSNLIHESSLLCDASVPPSPHQMSRCNSTPLHDGDSPTGDASQRHLGSMLRHDHLSQLDSRALDCPTPSAASQGRQSPGSRPASSPPCPASWQLPAETIFVFDWDDTLCPTTFIREDSRLNWNEEAPCFTTDPSMPLGSQDGAGGAEPMADSLRRHVEVASRALRAAAACGTVVIVTLAKTGWIELSSKNFLPGLLEVVRELGIRMVYARCNFQRWKVRSALLDELDVFRLMKEAAMSRCIKEVYKKRPDPSWKNIVSIGDSRTEQDALIEITFCRTQARRGTEQQACRCKTVKLAEEPDLPQLTAELEGLIDWLKPIALYDGDIKVDLSNSDGSISMLEKVLMESEQHACAGSVQGLNSEEPGGLLQLKPQVAM